MPPMKRMPTVMRQGHRFSMVPSVQIERSVLDRSHACKTTFDAGKLVPILVDEILPGDTITCRLSASARLTTPIKPLMDNMYLDSFFFFVPYRLVWTNWVRFMGEQDNPGDSIAYTVPMQTSPVGGYAVHSLADYFGLPTVGQVEAASTFEHSDLPGRAWFLIYNQWFRDQNLIGDVTVPLGDAGAVDLTFAPNKRGKRHDYFTACLPFLQKGEAVLLPLGTTAPVISDPASTGVPIFEDSNDGTPQGPLSPASAANTSAVQITAGSAWDPANTLAWSDPNLVADLTSAGAATINEFRQAIQIQKLLERDARGGTRYTELIFSHFRVKSPDARLQRSEYLGGGSTPVMIAPIAQTGQSGLTGGETPLGNLAAIGFAGVEGHGFTKSFTEHGVLIGLVNVRADLTYSQGLERMWSRSTRYDFYWPALSHIGEQAVLNKEIYLTGEAADDDVFGYQERYAEYRYKPSKVTGLFRPTAAGTLELWHLSEKFTTLPTLGTTFIQDNTETILDTRVAVPSEPDFFFDGWLNYRCARPMPVFGVPGFVDHF